MKTMRIIQSLTLSLFLLFLVGSCKKDTPDKPLVVPTGTAGTEELLKEAVYNDTYFFYLWQDQLPPFGRLNLANFKTAEEVLNELKGYAKDEEGRLLDRFSFLDRTGQVNSSIQEGLSGSFGFDVRYLNDNDLYIKLVYESSPAGKAGIERGWQILEINGNKNLRYSDFEADNFNFLNNALDRENQISLKLKRPDGEVVSVNLSRTNFQMQPILHKEIFTVGTKKVGYFVFDSFISTETSGGQETYVKHALDQLFAEFEAEGVTELITDLRYNGGGAVITAEYLSDLMAPTVADKKLMYSFQINKSMEENDWGELFPPVNFNKKNSLNLNKLYFLVTKGSTASASELLINNLMPFIETNLIGEVGTYGKPVGYFPWEIEKVDLYVVSFKTINSVGYGDYFFGLPVDKNASDDVSKNWGNPEESMLKQALHHIRNNAYLVSLPKQASRGALLSVENLSELNHKLDKKGNHDMFRFGKPDRDLRKNRGN